FSIAESDGCDHSRPSPGMDRRRASIACLCPVDPVAAEVPASYAIRRHAEGGGRKDILALGEPDGAVPDLQIEIYRAGSEAPGFDEAKTEIVANARALGPTQVTRLDEPLVSKFGPLTLVSFTTSKGTERSCLGFVRAYSDPRVQLSGWFCQG